MSKRLLATPGSKRVVLGALLAVVLGGSLYAYAATRPKDSERIAKAVQEVMAACAGAAYRPSCYDKEIPKLMGAFTMEQAFAVTRLVQEQDSSYQYCHVLGHELGAAEVKKDPSKWEEVAARCPAMMCSNGCMHGAFQERFRTDALSSEEVQKLEPEFANLCEAKPGFSPSELTKASCYHAVGHLLMYVTNADVATSIGLCRQVAVKADGRDYSQVCYDGVFMQIFQPLEPEDFALIKGKQPNAAQVPAFCALYPGAPGASCISESWPLFTKEIYQPSGPTNFCAQEDVSYRGRCLNSIFYIVMAMFALDQDKMDAYCAATPEDVRGTCYASAAARIIESDSSYASQAAAFCARAQAHGEGDACYGQLAEHASFDLKPGTPEFAALCAALPAKWQGVCAASATHKL